MRARIITIIDAEPITVTSLSIASSSGNNFARADQNIIITLETNSSNIANAIGTILMQNVYEQLYRRHCQLYNS